MLLVLVSETIVEYRLRYTEALSTVICETMFISLENSLKETWSTVLVVDSVEIPLIRYVIPETK